MCWPAFRLLSPKQSCKYGYMHQCFRPEICHCGVAVECVQDWGEVRICMKNSSSGIGQALICIEGLFFVLGAITAYVKLSRYLWSLYNGHCTSVIVQLVFCAFVLSIWNRILSIRLWQMTTNLASGFHCALPFEGFQLTSFISRVRVPQPNYRPDTGFRDANWHLSLFTASVTQNGTDIVTKRDWNQWEN